MRKVIETEYNKVFCIGSNKTGTTTLERVLQQLQFRMPNQQDQERALTQEVLMGNYDTFKNYVENWNAFQDNPFSYGLTFVVADTLFPNSKFILTERDPEDWFKSLVKFHAKTFGFKDPSNVMEDDVRKFSYLYPGYTYEIARTIITTFDGSSRVENWSSLYDKNVRIKTYLERNDLIKRYFMNSPEKLLVIDATSSKDTSEICNFLHFPKNKVTKMPHLNKS